MAFFSSSVLQRLQDAQRVLLSPLDYGNRTAWYHAAADRLQTLMECEFVFTISASEPSDIEIYSPYSDAGLANATETYMKSLSSDTVPMPARLQMERIRRGNGAYHELELAERSIIEQSPYYQDIAQPRGLGYATGLTAVSQGREVTFCVMFRHRDAPGYQPEATRRLAALVPTLEAGLHHRSRLKHVQARLRSLVDTLDDAAALFSIDGREQHRNTALTVLLRDEPNRATLMRAARLLAIDVIEVQTMDDGASPAPVEQTVDLPSGHYTLRATYSGQLLDEDSPVLLTVTRTSPFPPPEALQQRWELTEREAEVALHVAQGRTNSAIADALSISPHTTRHHVSSVLAKLDVDSRTEVPGALITSG